MVSFVLGKEIKKDVFVLSQAWDMSLSHASDKTKKHLSLRIFYVRQEMKEPKGLMGVKSCHLKPPPLNLLPSSKPLMIIVP